MTDLLQHLAGKILQIESDRWGERDAPVVRLSDDTRLDGTNGFSAGTIEVWTPTRDGSRVLFVAEPLCGVADVVAADDCLAAAISKALAAHTRWARQ